MDYEVARLASTSAAWRVAARQLSQVLRHAERVDPHSGIDLDDTWAAWRICPLTWELPDNWTLAEGGQRYGRSSLAEAVDRWLFLLEVGTELDPKHAAHQEARSC